MRRFLSLATALAALLGPIAGPTLPARAADTFNITGYVESEFRLTIQGKSQFTFNENTFQLALFAYPADNVSLLGSFRLVGIGVDDRVPDDTITIYQQSDPEVVDPIRVLLDEAYINISGLVLKNLDVKLGKQRIQWGTGDQFNPTDNLNPDDLWDPLLFGKKIPTAALQLNYYLGPVTITGVLLPLFTPALLPKADIQEIGNLQFRSMSGGIVIDTGDPALDGLIDQLMDTLLPSMEIGSLHVVSRLPDKSAQNISAAVKVAAKVKGVDLSASYAYVFDDFGVPRQVDMQILLERLNAVNVTTVLEYPRQHVFGFDFTTAIPGLDVGVWGEFAYFISEPFPTDYYISVGTDRYPWLSNIIAQTPLTGQGFRIATEHPLEKDFIKATAGCDYTFPGSYYVNFQYVRGLPNGNTSTSIHDFVWGGLDKPFYHDVFKARFFFGYDFNDGSAVAYPSLYWWPMDALELHVGTFFVFGPLDTQLGAFGDSFVFLRGRLTF
jgi:hypothetical protein